jgi:D-threonate/D-erythronate kinase
MRRDAWRSVHPRAEADTLVSGVAIIADDLTGALDAAAPLRRQGFRATVALGPQYLADALHADVVAVTTESRAADDPGPVLAQTVVALSADQLLFKKIDSTLRGPIAAELRHLLDLTGRRAAVVAPALPQQGRALVHGFLVLDGRATDRHLPTILAASGLPTTDIRLAVVRDPRSFHRALERASREAALIVVDAETDDDLQAIALAVGALPAPPLLAGSAGLAAWLPVVGKLKPVERLTHTKAIEGPVLWAFGSANQRTHQQIAELRSVGVTSVAFDPRIGDASSTIALGVDVLASGHDLVMSVVPPMDSIEAMPLPQQRAVAQRLARVVAAMVARTHVDALVMGGGDTAYAVCDALGIRRLELIDEVLPGLPLSEGTTSAGHVIRCITKAGGFGTPDALRHVYATLHGVSTP